MKGTGLDEVGHYDTLTHTLVLVRDSMNNYAQLCGVFNHIICPY